MDVMKREEVITQLLDETSKCLGESAVHKTMLTALLVAAAEDPASMEFDSEALDSPVAVLNEALLRLRLEGKVTLTEKGFALAQPSLPAEGTQAAFGEFLRQKIMQKLQEWALNTPKLA